MDRLRAPGEEPVADNALHADKLAAPNGRPAPAARQAAANGTAAGHPNGPLVLKSNFDALGSDNVPEPTAAVLLDHDMYPHIIEKIMACLPPESIGLARALCRPLKKYIEAIMYRHIEIIHCPATAAPQHLYATTSVPLEIRFPLGGPRIPGLRWGEDDPAAHARCRRRISEHCKILDDFRAHTEAVRIYCSICNHICEAPGVTDLATVFRNVDRFRFKVDGLWGEDVNPPPYQICDHGGHQFEEEDEHFPHLEPNSQVIIPPEAPITESIKIVATVFFDLIPSAVPDDQSDYEPFFKAFWKGDPYGHRLVKDVEFVFVLIGGHTEARMTPRFDPPIIHTLMWSGDTRYRKGRCTLVGAEQVPKCSPFSAASFFTDNGPPGLGGIKEYWQRGANEVLTLGEYRERVGEEAFALTVTEVPLPPAWKKNARPDRYDDVFSQEESDYDSEDAFAEEPSAGHGGAYDDAPAG